jgi:hypothetical protein
MHHQADRPALQLEKYSSAVTLSDMEIFVFPELLFSLVLANILSPRIWAWREDPWFEGIDRLKPHRRVLRLKQYIIDHYEFNLDLDTWGLTTKAREVGRFREFLDDETLRQSNALFGYEGDKYYFDLDIRRHFGLDKYTTDIIPYWKTETVEAMDAFRHKPGYRVGAGECVSLSTLYAAALYIVAGVPLEDIYLLATPLHSQNFVRVQDGILTNNRRVVTKNMWFNGTELSAKAQRALRHERVTVVANNTGWVHTLYPEATIDPENYRRGTEALRAFLRTDVDLEILANFLRDVSRLQKCFQIRHTLHGKPRYIAAERVYAYEHQSRFRVSDNTRDKLLEEIDEDEFFPDPLPDRIVLNKFEDFFRNRVINLDLPEHRAALLAEFGCSCGRTEEIQRQLLEFTRVQPRLPDAGKRFVPSEPIAIRPGMDRAEILAYLEGLRTRHPVADLAFYAARDLSRCDWRPFLKAALERNPVVVQALAAESPPQAAARLLALPEDSIYDGTRLAQPDEVWNYGRGDGVEKLIALANLLLARDPAASCRLRVEADQAILESPAGTFTAPSRKGLRYSGTLVGAEAAAPATAGA